MSQHQSSVGKIHVNDFIWYISSNGDKFEIRDIKTGGLIATLSSQHFSRMIVRAPEMFAMLKMIEPEVNAIEVTGLITMIEGIKP